MDVADQTAAKSKHSIPVQHAERVPKKFVGKQKSQRWAQESPLRQSLSQGLGAYLNQVRRALPFFPGCSQPCGPLPVQWEARCAMGLPSHHPSPTTAPC